MAQDDVFGPSEGGSALKGKGSRKVTIWARRLALPALALAVVAAYLPGLSAPFVFDDVLSIAENPLIRTLWPPPFFYPEELRGITVAGRPLLGFTFSLNYALGGLATWQYRAVNVAIHLLAAFTLFFLLRGTLRSRAVLPRYRSAAFPLAFFATLLWAVHPLLTQAVTYTVQRAESLMGLFFLLVLLLLAKSARSARPGAMLAASAACCIAGGMVKEVAAVAPVAALLYDRAFMAGTFAGALKARKWYYAALALVWPLTAYLLATTGMHSGSAGAGAKLGWTEYLRVQGWAVARYLKLALWPSGLTFDYGAMTWIVGRWETLAACGFAAALSALALWLAVKRPAAGFAPLLFFLILAPTSSVVPILDPVMEHRMYLPLAALSTLAAIGLYELARGLGRGAGRWRIGYAAGAALALVLAIATGARNHLYNDPEMLWADTLAKSPENSRAAFGVGIEREKSGDPGGAALWYVKALELNPDDSDANYNYGVLLMRSGDLSGAAAHFERAVNIHPRYNTARYNLALALIGLGRPLEAAERLRECLLYQPGEPRLEFELGRALYLAGETGEGIGRMIAAIRKEAPVRAFEALGDALAESHRGGEAADYYARGGEKARASGDGAVAERLSAKAAKAAKGEW